MKVVVLGAGVIGTTSAYFLAKQGHEVTVIERQNSVAMETSHANAGCLSYGFTSPWAGPGLPLSILKWTLTGRSPLIINPNMSIETVKFLYRMYKNCNTRSYEVNKSRMLRIAKYSQKALIEIESDFDFNYDQRKQGSLQLFWDTKEIEKSRRDIAILEKFNIKSELLTAEDCVKTEPGLKYVKNKLAGGIQFKDDFTGNCYMFSNEIYKKCVEIGVNFEFNTDIKSIQINNNKVSSVSTDRGEFNADAYSVSLGSYSSRILSKIGIQTPIYPVKGYSITLPVLNDGDAPQSTIMDEKNKIAITRLGDTIRVAGMAHLTDFDKNLRTKSLDSLMRGLDLITYPWNEERMEPDIDAAAKLIREVKPNLALFGQSVFLFPTPLKELSDAAHEVGAKVMYDGAHVLGLIAGGQFQKPLSEGADEMPGSRLKTFLGHHGGFVW